MSNYKPPYPVIRPEQMRPRSEIHIDPEHDLDTFGLAELKNLRRRVPYKIVVGDTPTNREAICLKTAYFQMAAWKEGWTFRPEDYQVTFIDPKDGVFANRGQARIYQFNRGSPLEQAISLSAENRLGVRVQRERVQKMGHEETDGIANWMLHLLDRNRQE